MTSVIVCHHLANHILRSVTHPKGSQGLVSRTLHYTAAFTASRSRDMQNVWPIDFVACSFAFTAVLVAWYIAHLNNFDAKHTLHLKRNHVRFFLCDSICAKTNGEHTPRVSWGAVWGLRAEIVQRGKTSREGRNTWCLIIVRKFI